MLFRSHAHIQNPVHLYTVSGNHLVTLVVTNASGCSHSINKQVQVIPSPVAGFSNSISNCAGSEVSFNDLSYPIVGYLVKWIWNFGDGNSETILFPNPQNVSHIYNNAGNYNVSLSVQTNDSCSASIAHLVTVGDTPLANFDYGYNRCEGSAVQFEDLSQPSGGVQIISWNWNFGDPASGVNNTSSLKNPVHVYQNPYS